MPLSPTKGPWGDDAKTVIEDYVTKAPPPAIVETILIEPEDYDRILQDCLSPQEPSPAMIAGAELHAKLVRNNT
jgi:hypothetical protein